MLSSEWASGRQPFIPRVRLPSLLARAASLCVPVYAVASARGARPSARPSARDFAILVYALPVRRLTTMRYCLRKLIYILIPLWVTLPHDYKPTGAHAGAPESDFEAAYRSPRAPTPDRDPRASVPFVGTTTSKCPSSSSSRGASTRVCAPSSSICADATRGQTGIARGQLVINPLAVRTH